MNERLSKVLIKSDVCYLTELIFTMLICKKYSLNFKFNQVDTLTFILSIAYSVLSGIILDLMKDNGKAGLKDNIELEVVRQVREEFKRIERQPPEQEIKTISDSILKEIKNLVNKDPDLKFSDDKIELKKPVGKPILPFSDRGVDQEVEIRLERLKEIIAQRRKELGLPPESKEENLKDNLSGWEPVDNLQLEQSREETLTESQSPEATVRWEPIGKEETETPWQKKKKKAIRDIQIIRAGGEVIDDE